MAIAYNKGLAVRHPDEVMEAILQGRPVSVLEDWLNDLGIFFEELMQ
jgi:hypothetical protein